MHHGINYLSVHKYYTQSAEIERMYLQPFFNEIFNYNSDKTTKRDAISWSTKRPYVIDMIIMTAAIYSQNANVDVFGPF